MGPKQTFSEEERLRTEYPRSRFFGVLYEKRRTVLMILTAAVRVDVLASASSHDASPCIPHGSVRRRGPVSEPVQGAPRMATDAPWSLATGTGRWCLRRP